MSICYFCFVIMLTSSTGISTYVHTPSLPDALPICTITRPILNRLKPDAKLIVIDTNPDFCEYLRHEFNDPRLIVANRSAADLGAILAEHGCEGADYVISGLPFSTLPPGVGRSEEPTYELKSLMRTSYAVFCLKK